MKLRKLLPALLLLLSILLMGCGKTAGGSSSGKREAECRKIAADYLTSLSSTVSDELQLVEGSSDQYGETYAFPASSKQYPGTFLVYVNTDNKAFDTYYAVSLRESAETELKAICSDIFGEQLASLEVGFSNAQASTLSGKKFESIYDLYAAEKRLELLTISLTTKEEKAPEEAVIRSLLHTLAEKGLFSTISITGELRSFVVNEDGLFYEVSDTDGGKGIRRSAYE